MKVWPRWVKAARRLIWLDFLRISGQDLLVGIPENLDSDSNTHQLDDLEQIPLPLWFSVSICKMVVIIVLTAECCLRGKMR